PKIVPFTDDWPKLGIRNPDCRPSCSTGCSANGRYSTGMLRKRNVEWCSLATPPTSKLMRSAVKVHFGCGSSHEVMAPSCTTNPLGPTLSTSLPEKVNGF